MDRIDAETECALLEKNMRFAFAQYSRREGLRSRSREIVFGINRLNRGPTHPVTLAVRYTRENGEIDFHVITGFPIEMNPEDAPDYTVIRHPDLFIRHRKKLCMVQPIRSLHAKLCAAKTIGVDDLRLDLDPKNN